MSESPAETALIRILVISPWKSRWSLEGGAGVSDDVRFVTRLCASGFELHFLIPSGGASATLPIENFHTHTYPNFFDATRWLPVPVKRVLWPFLFNTIVIPHALRLTRRLSPDFLLGHSNHGSFPAWMCREFFNIPSGLKLFGVMDLVHTEWPAWKYNMKNFEQICALKIPHDVWIILDDGTKGREAAIRHGVPPDRIHFLPNGINIEWAGEVHDRTAAREAMSITADAKVVLFLARFVASKRPEAVVEAIPAVTEGAGPDVVFLFVGDGPQRAPCERLAARLGVGDRTRFVGARPHEQVPDIMAAADVFVSTSNLTNMAIPTCEAMVCGLPVVAFDVGNTRDVVLDGETGFAVADGDTAALADAIVRVISDPKLGDHMSTRARETALEKFTGWDERVDMEIDIIRGVIGERRTS